MTIPVAKLEQVQALMSNLKPQNRARFVKKLFQLVRVHLRGDGNTQAGDGYECISLDYFAGITNDCIINEIRQRKLSRFC